MWQVLILLGRFVPTQNIISRKITFSQSLIKVITHPINWKLDQPKAKALHHKNTSTKTSSLNQNAPKKESRPGKLKAGTWKSTVWKRNSSEPNLHVWVPAVNFQATLQPISPQKTHRSQRLQQQSHGFSLGVEPAIAGEVEPTTRFQTTTLCYRVVKGGGFPNVP